MSKTEIRMARLKDIAFVFQDPMTYLNPVLTVGSQLTEILASNPKAFKEELVRHRLSSIENLRRTQGSLPRKVEEEKRRLEAAGTPPKIGKREVKRLAALRGIEYLKIVKLPDPERVYKMYPFELSGGMRQRTMIAMALIRRPKVLLADEITTALDVTVQAQVLKLLRELRSEIEGSIILITHDMAVIAEIADRVAVMYAGNIVEIAPSKELFSNPLHPYTQGLLASIPRPDAAQGELRSIVGTVPNLIYPPSGCRFHPRCPKAFDRCPNVKPPLVQVGPDHYVECLLYGG
jgi:peptide/nickel transport system ATP-binding protein